MNDKRTKTTAQVPAAMVYGLKAAYYAALSDVSSDNPELRIKDAFFTSILSQAVENQVPDVDGIGGVVSALMNIIPVADMSESKMSLALDFNVAALSIGKTTCAFAQSQLMQKGIGRGVITMADFVVLAAPTLSVMDFWKASLVDRISDQIAEAKEAKVKEAKATKAKVKEAKEAKAKVKVKGE